MKIAHVINTTEINESKKASYLHIAQPVTMKTMVAAKKYAADYIDIDLLAVKHKSEQVVTEADFRCLPDIEKYAYEYIDVLKDVENKKPLPRLADIINAAFDNTDAEYLIYTNLDIGLQPHFYLRVKELIDEGYDAITINRRDLDKEHDSTLLDENNIEFICSLDGHKHPGIDCVVFKRDLVPKFQFNNVMVGFPPIGQVLKTQVEKYSKKAIWIKDEKLAFHIGQDMAWQRGEQKHMYWLENDREAEGLYTPQFSEPRSTLDKIKSKLKSEAVTNFV